MTVPVSQILSNVTTLLRDTGSSRRWPDTELLKWLNLGQKQIATMKSDSVGLITQVQLAAGKTLQSLPDGSGSFVDASSATLPAGLKLMGVTRNLGANGLVPGRVISLIDRGLMDNINPDWHSSTANTIIQHFMFDEMIPRNFFVYPRVHEVTPVWVEIHYAFVPPAAGLGSNISLPDEYEAVLTDYILFRAYSKEQESPAAAGKAVAYYQAYRDGLDLQRLSEAETDPNVDQKPSPSYKKS